MEIEHASFCRICAAACGVLVTTDDQRVVRVRGDAAHPISRGYVCSKARGLPEWHHGPRRLSRPRLDGEEVSWDRLLDDLADRVRSAIDTSGVDAIAMYLATGLAYDAGGQVAAGMWMRTIGSSSFYSAATVDNAPILVAAELVTGNPMLNPVWNPDEPGLLILVGTNPVVSHGYGTTLPDPVRRLRDFRSAGGRVWVLDPRRTESAALADEHLAVRPGSDVVVLAAIARELLADFDQAGELCAAGDIAALRDALDGFTVDRAAHAAGVDAAAISGLIAEVRDFPGRLAMFCGTGTTMSTDGILTEWLRWVLLIVTGSLDRPGGMRFNRGVVNRPRPPRADSTSGAVTLSGPASRPGLPRVAGQMPAVALVDEIEAGHVRVLFVTGGNLLTALPEPDRVRAALGMLDSLVVVDVLDSEMAGLATHVLPATGQLERADLSLAEHVSIRSGIQATRAVVEAAEERKPVWWMFDALAQRLGVGASADRSIDVTDESFLSGLLAHGPLDPAEVFAAGPHGVDVPIEFGWVRATMLPDGHWQIAPPAMLARLAAHREPADGGVTLTPRREMAWSNSVRYGAGRERSELRVHARDLADAGLVDGDAAVITSAHGSVTAMVTVDDNIRPGVASLTHGHPTDGPGNLTSSTHGIDPLTTMPHASGLPVTITRAAVR